MHETGGIPKFDLAEQIMAEQRKIAATKRKGPGRKVEPPKPPRKSHSSAAYAAPPPILSEQQRIIAEIVSRDIKKLFAGGASGV